MIPVNMIPDPYTYNHKGHQGYQGKPLAWISHNLNHKGHKGHEGTTC
jgi:hypothetical protein